MCTVIQFHVAWALGVRGVNPEGVGGVVTPRFWAGGREILLYFIMYRKYVRKWWLLKRNRMICPEAAVNGQFCQLKFCCEIAWKNQNFSEICMEKSNIFGEIAWKNQNFSEICLEKSKYFWPGSTIPPDIKPDWRRCRLLQYLLDWLEFSLSLDC